MKKILKENLYIHNKKSGISLIVLVLTIIIALILIATAVISTVTAIDNANLAVFTKDLTEIQDATEGYYLTNKAMPILDTTTVMNKDDVIAIARSGNLLLEEITENHDIDSQFYTIDLAKIDVTKTPYGDNKFIVSFPEMNVYYPQGIDAKGTIYFSITSKISNITKISSEQLDNSTTSVISSGGIKVTKTDGWANKMGVNIEAEMASDELLYMSVSGDSNRPITTVTGKNTFGFNLLTSIVSNIETIKVPTLTVAEANYIELGVKPLVDRYVDILKYKNGEIIGKVRIDLSNFSKSLPTITSATLASYPTMNTVKLLLANTVSEIKEVRYEYLTKYTDEGTIENYYENITDFDSVYMQSKAKKSKIATDLTSTINAPKNVQGIKILIVDNAGNVNLYNQEIAPRLYIGYSLDRSEPNLLQITSKMFSANGIKSVTFSKSVDGINFTDEQIYTLNTTTNGLTVKQNVPFTNNAGNNAYIKMVAVNYNSTITETRTIRINIATAIVTAQNKPVLAIGMSAVKWDGTSWITVSNPNIDTSWYNYDTVNKQWANAQTADGSMWVWVPRYIYKISSLWHASSSVGGTISIQFSQGINDNWNSGVIGAINVATGAAASNNTWTNQPAFTFGSTQLTGIWVAKFEASGTTNSVDIKPGVSSFRNITISTIFSECRNMETNNRYGWGTSGIGIDTHLTKNVEWGAAAYLTESAYGKNEGEMAVNNNASYYTGGTSYITNLAQSTTDNVYGIYDMAGGAGEYTAAYLNNANSALTTNGNSLLNAASQYKDIYVITTDTQTNNYTGAANKKGDAVYETSSTFTGSSSWFIDYSAMPYTTNPFFIRGGNYNDGTTAGTFNFNLITGAAIITNGFRPTLLVDTTL